MDIFARDTSVTATGNAPVLMVDPQSGALSLGSIFSIGGDIINGISSLFGYVGRYSLAQTKG